MRPDIQYKGTLDDGTQLLFRPIRPADKGLLARGLGQLSPASRYLRFFSSIDHFTAGQLRYLTEVDFVDHFAWVALRSDVSDEGVGVARWIRLKDDPGQAEAAVTVIDEMQRRGVGTALLWLLTRSALERGITAFRVAVLGENHPMLHVLAELGAQRAAWESGVVEYVVPLSGQRLAEPPTRLVLKVVAAGLDEEG